MNRKVKVSGKSRKMCAVATALAVALPALAGVPIGGGDASLLYTGRIDFTHAQAPQMSWPGSSVAGNFTGSALSVTLDDERGRNYFNVFIDGDLRHPQVIEARKGEHRYMLADGLPSGRHAFLLTKRTEGEEGATTVTGFELADGGALLPPPLRPARRIEFFGDAITTWRADEAPDDGRDDRRAEKNNFVSYDAITARNLGAELHVTSQSGIGLMVSWFPFTMPRFHAQLNAVGSNDSHWDFASWTPQVVVINLLQNDKWLIENEHRLQPEPTDDQRMQAYVDFVGVIRKHYPDAWIVCALGSMDATRTGSKWPGYVSAAVARMKGQGDRNVDTIFFEFTGYGAHPRAKQHAAMAERLTAFIKERMHW